VVGSGGGYLLGRSQLFATGKQDVAPGEQNFGPREQQFPSGSTILTPGSKSLLPGSIMLLPGSKILLPGSKFLKSLHPQKIGPPIFKSWLSPDLRRNRGPANSKRCVPEGSLEGFFGCRETALELICGADFSCKLMCRAGPGDPGGSRGAASAENPRKTGPKISCQTAFRYPVS